MVALLTSHCEMYALYPNTDENDCRVLSEESYTIRVERVCVCVCVGGLYGLLSENFFEELIRSYRSKC